MYRCIFAAMVIMTPFRTAIRESRLTLAELHRLSGVSLNTLRSLHSGRNANPKLTTRRKLASALREHSSALAALADQIEAS